ncbi:MAG TPA: hypothetical protein VGN20_20675 [Mucilaginibacter sp.]|jgi:hypothetical protein
MHGASSQERYLITYFYNGQNRTSEITEVFTVNGPRYYWLRFKKRPPQYIKQDGDTWTSEGKPELPSELVDALIQAIKAYKTPDFRGE